MMQRSVRALKVVPSYTVQIVHEMGSNNTANIHTHNARESKTTLCDFVYLGTLSCNLQHYPMVYIKAYIA